MRLGCLVAAALVVATAACGASAAAPTRSTTTSRATGTDPCGPGSARTLVADDQARIFSRSGSVYGCARGGHSVYLLGSASRAHLGRDRVGLVALAGVDAAYSVSQGGVDTVSAEVIVRRLDTGRMLRDLSAITQSAGPEFFDSVEALVVRSDGAVAWIAKTMSIVRHGNTIEVDRADHRGETNLDRSSTAALTSLRLRGSQLSWRHGDVTRTATLL